MVVLRSQSGEKGRPSSTSLSPLRMWHSMFLSTYVWTFKYHFTQMSTHACPHTNTSKSNIGKERNRIEKNRCAQQACSRCPKPEKAPSGNQTQNSWYHTTVVTAEQDDHAVTSAVKEIMFPTGPVGKTPPSDCGSSDSAAARLWQDDWCLLHEASETGPSLCPY